MVPGSLKNPHAVIVAALTVLLLGAVAVTRISVARLRLRSIKKVSCGPDGPGLGLEVDENLLRQYPIAEGRGLFDRSGLDTLLEFGQSRSRSSERGSQRLVGERVL